MTVLRSLRRFVLALRFAWRAARQAPGQSVLIVFLMMVPLASVATSLTVIESRTPTPIESVTMRMGQAEALLLVVSPPDRSLSQNPIDPETWKVQSDLETGERLFSDRGDPTVDPAALLPAGTRIVAVVDKGALIVETATGRGAVKYIEGEVWDPALDGAFTLQSGRAPASLGEVVVTASTLERLGKRVGDEFVSLNPAVTLTIVGVLDEATQPDAINIVYAPPGTVPGSGPTRYFLPDYPLAWNQVQELNRSGIVAWSRQVFLDPPADADYRYDGQQGAGVVLALVIVFGVFQIVLLAGAAFLIGARRQQRTFALLSSNGAERGTLVQIITAGGIVLGAIAGVGGVALGTGIAWLYTRLTDTGDATVLPGFHVPWLMLAIAALLTAAIGWAAALVPALIASKINVMAALRGATRPAQLRPRSLHAGLALFAVGLSIAGASIIALSLTGWGFLADITAAENALIIVLIVLIVAGAILVAIGMLLLLSRILKAFARAGSTAALPIRMALRDLALNAPRFVPVVAVILTTVSIATFVMSAQAFAQTLASTYRVLPALSSQATIPIFSSNAYDGDPTPTAVEAARIASQLTTIAQSRLDLDNSRTVQRPWQDWTAWATDAGYPRVLPQRDSAQVCPTDAATEVAIDPKDPRCDFRYALLHLSSDGPGAPNILIGDADDLALLAGAPVTEAQRTTLAQGGAIAFWPQLIDSTGNATLTWISTDDGGPSETVRTERLPATLIRAPERLAYGLFMSPETATALDLDPVDALIVMDLADEPNTATLDALNAEMAAVYPGAPFLDVVADPADEGEPFQWLVLGLVLLATISAAALAIGLARMDGRRAEFTLWSIGADPTVTRLVAGLQTGVQALVGVSLGVLVGLIPGYGIFGAPTTGIDVSPPWLQLSVLLVGLPLLFGLGAAFTAARSPRLAGKRPDIT